MLFRRKRVVTMFGLSDCLRSEGACFRHYRQSWVLRKKIVCVTLFDCSQWRECETKTIHSNRMNGVRGTRVAVYAPPQHLWAPSTMWKPHRACFYCLL